MTHTEGGATLVAQAQPLACEDLLHNGDDGVTTVASRAINNAASAFCAVLVRSAWSPCCGTIHQVITRDRSGREAIVEKTQAEDTALADMERIARRERRK